MKSREDQHHDAMLERFREIPDQPSCYFCGQMADDEGRCLNEHCLRVGRRSKPDQDDER